MEDDNWKDNIISNTYHDENGFGSRVDTYKKAHALEPEIGMKDVAAWYEANVENKKKLPGYNSFVAHKPHEEYQVDLMWITDKVIPKTVIKQHQQPNTKDEKGKKVTGKKLDVETTEYDPLPDSKKPLMVFCDVFTRRIWVIPLEGSKAPALIAALQQGFVQMGGKPEILYSDQEGGIKSNEAQEWFGKNNIKSIFTRAHAAFVERQIRTIKDMILKRLEKSQDWASWRTPEFLARICKIRNEGRENATTQMKPIDAEKEENHEPVLTRLEAVRKTNRSYSPLRVGDRVKYYGPKKKAFDKEFTSVWDKKADRIKSIVRIHDQNFYKLEQEPGEFLRAELLKLH